MDLNLPYSASSVVREVSGAYSLLPQGDLGTLLLGGVLVLAALVIVFLLKRILENAVIGVVGFLLLKYFLDLKISLVAGLIISLLFGLAGLGVLVILHFFGMM